MKRLVVLSIVLFFATGAVFASERGSIPTSAIPEVIEKVGSATKAEILETAFYPAITADGDVDPECQAELDILAGKPILQKSSITKRHVKQTLSGDKLRTGRISSKGPIEIKDLETTVHILPAYKRTAKILVFWTIRVGGECPAWRIREDLCDSFNAQAEFTCPPNDVHTYVSVNGKIKRPPATLQIPRMKGSSDESDFYDPTITGTYVITTDDFKTESSSAIPEFPDDVIIKIYWENDGSQRVTSPPGMRNMIVNLIPYSRTDK